MVEYTMGDRIIIFDSTIPVKDYTTVYINLPFSRGQYIL